MSYIRFMAALAALCILAMPAFSNSYPAGEASYPAGEKNRPMWQGEDRLHRTTDSLVFPAAQSICPQEKCCERSMAAQGNEKTCKCEKPDLCQESKNACSGRSMMGQEEDNKGCCCERSMMGQDNNKINSMMDKCSDKCSEKDSKEIRSMMGDREKKNDESVKIVLVNVHVE